MRRYLFILSLIWTSLAGQAQQEATFDHYLVHPYMINPAGAGLTGNSVFIDFRKQWNGFVGAPETQYLAVDGTINREQMGLGLTVINDQVNVIGKTTIQATYAYRLKFSENHKLRLGMSAGLSQNRIIFNRVIAEDPSELQLFNTQENAATFDASAGLIYTLYGFQLGFAASNLFTGRYYYENNYNSSSLRYQDIRHFRLNSQYLFNLQGGKWGVMPAIQLRSAQGIPPIFEGGVTGYFKDKMWMTLRYMHEIGYNMSIGGLIASNVVAAYAYTISSNGMYGYNLGSHDVIIGFRFPSSKNKGNAIDPKLLDDLNRKNNELFERADFLKNENEQLRIELEEQKKALKENIYGFDSLRKTIKNNQEDLKKFIEENQKKLNSLPNNGSNSTNSNVGNGSDHNNQGGGVGTPPEITNNGKVYVIVGAFYNLEDSKRFQAIVQREYNESTKVIQSDNQIWFFVYTKSFDTKEDAVPERDRTEKLDKKGIFIGGPWYYFKK